jgi:hypothetical protein
MKKFIEAIYDPKSEAVLVRNPKNPDIWVTLHHFEEICSEKETVDNCTYTEETYEVCSGVSVGPAPDYIQTPFGCKLVTKTVCSCD